jgi:hypothetical protein
MTSPLTTLENDLTTLVTTAGVAKDPLTAAQDVLSLLADQTLVGSSIGEAVTGVYTTIANTINDDLVSALQGIANELKSLTSLSVSDATAALGALQNALQTAQSLVPGGSSAVASAFAATAQFATMFGNLLQEAGTVTAAAGTLDTIALQLGTIATAFSTAAAGNP